MSCVDLRKYERLNYRSL